MQTLRRIRFEEGLDLFTNCPLEDIRRESASAYRTLFPTSSITYVLDTNPNYSNICTTHCSFCSFCRNETDKDAYFKTVQEVLQDIAQAKRCGATTVLLQGGLSPRLTLDYLLEIVQESRRLFPDIHPHFFSAPEIAHAAKNSHVSIETALRTLYDAGLTTIPGAGAEILTERVHAKICKNKISPQEWLSIHEQAHRMGYHTTATMMFGHVEEDRDIVEHLFRLREVQDTTQGFLSFIPWSFKPSNNPLGRNSPNTASPELYYRILAFSRLFLDNFPHITASWFGEGKQAGIRALAFGADDFGGTILSESVHKAAGHINTSSEQEVRKMISSAGFTPIQRDSFFKNVKTL